MTDSEILQKAIEKVGIAILLPNYEIGKWKVISPLGSPVYLSVYVWSRDHTNFDADHPYEVKRYLEQIIFSHDFAKAFWGEEAVRWEGNGPWYGAKFVGPAWKWHLSQMVLEPEALKYLEKFLEEDQ
jgi:hypothetical protein